MLLCYLKDNLCSISKKIKELTCFETSLCQKKQEKKRSPVITLLVMELEVER